eukprot:2518825-Karenia_brevis.AAC.1
MDRHNSTQLVVRVADPFRSEDDDTGERKRKELRRGGAKELTSRSKRGQKARDEEAKAAREQVLKALEDEALVAAEAFLKKESV